MTVPAGGLAAILAAWFTDGHCVDVDGPAPRRDLADVLFGLRPRPNAAGAAGEATGLLAAHPGCVLVVLPLAGGRWLAVGRTPSRPWQGVEECRDPALVVGADRRGQRQRP
ncbi:hypothetical protein [Streptomyces neyagawaensis]|uniref:hypothetical protein n=1 Tax=Streptomyces neyagawaensis TaxID=42238 RepID=UPI0006E1943A|nr:hypothetical protein [Streptomyces neyagawaensis]MCL6731917.1 hypothetical protein [Streptomyces neyagawaensis]MDE1682590.1 hypothetical protein [Streptomyces neyagawaensis]